mmetsp:Transcript_38293/g.50226  ORF Transcript_38293/g.50226 Transcript_38293/m.50226 type:complete len:118 (+) Transcript_38293:196-549(+)|eukprot:CAMPEP_0185569708 /NCGR_PEP_ID=MMETSP0434-20130131/2247_1 /TAXON_ID=626734 ORGANISM="Favella taraikaensis, Strain Fe Narragansett Bay" /NCGR_SAMPLE_ID=MMETSP0434 /ASSEMBLY_ACC=CAM_ASM_000379 /LENGTH=117 /DNA_ID=CAMNT_0028184577 /DNA_START=196 /DNA_END=549 /DNA_ORIENTATION=-
MKGVASAAGPALAALNQAQCDSGGKADHQHGPINVIDNSKPTIDFGLDGLAYDGTGYPNALSMAMAGEMGTPPMMCMPMGMMGQMPMGMQQSPMMMPQAFSYGGVGIPGSIPYPYVY